MSISRRTLLRLASVTLSGLVSSSLTSCGGSVSSTPTVVAERSPSLVAVETSTVAGARAGESKETLTREPRVPPGQHVVERFPVLDLGISPNVPLDEWTLKVGGEVAKPAVLSWVDFQSLPHVERVWDFHCVTGWSKLGVRWGGVLLSEIVSLVEPGDTVVAVVFDSRDGYSTNLDYQETLGGEVLLADQLEHELLSFDHGGPVRGVVPYLYGWKSAKFVSSIRFEPVDEPGYWEVRGYHNHGDPWKEERFGRSF